MEILAKNVEQQLKKRGFCVVFEDELERCWPKEKLKPRERERQIQAFAESQGWNAFIHNSDFGPTRAVFAADASLLPDFILSKPKGEASGL